MDQINTKYNSNNKALVVGAGQSKIGISIANTLSKNFHVIKTSNSNSDFVYLDITNSGSIKNFIELYINKFGRAILDVLFLNSGIMNHGDTITRSNFFKRVNLGDKELCTHINNLLLVENLKSSGLITKKTKIIYNASIQAIKPKEGYEDYGFLKYIVSRVLLGDSELDVTVLCMSLIKGTAMEENFKKSLEKDKIGAFKEYINSYMPMGQPSLKDVSFVTNYVLSNKESTSNKIILIDGDLSKNIGTQYNNSTTILKYDPQKNIFTGFTSSLKDIT